jgi:hypothetical protein
MKSPPTRLSQTAHSTRGTKKKKRKKRNKTGEKRVSRRIRMCVVKVTAADCKRWRKFLGQVRALVRAGRRTRRGGASAHRSRRSRSGIDAALRVQIEIRRRALFDGGQRSNAVDPVHQRSCEAHGKSETHGEQRPPPRVVHHPLFDMRNLRSYSSNLTVRIAFGLEETPD